MGTAWGELVARAFPEGTRSLLNLGTIARTSALRSGTVLNNDINTEHKGEKYGRRKDSA